jgi:hypothetical protein
MSPEQAAGSHSVGAATDVYSLGAILFELLTGKPPFCGGTVMETLQDVMDREPPSMKSMGGGIPRDLETICRKCLEKQPARRYATAEALAEDLRRFQAGEPICARRVGELERLWLWARRRPSMAGLLLAFVLTLLAGTIVSVCLAVVAQRRADVAQDNEAAARRARASESEARRAADLQSAELKFHAGLARAEAGEVAEALYAWLDAWRQVDRARDGEAEMGKADELRRLIRLNIAAWSRQLPILEQVSHLEGPAPPASEHFGNARVWMVRPEDRVLPIARGSVLQRRDRMTGQPLGPARRVPNEWIGDVSPDGRHVVTFDPHTFHVRDARGRPLGPPSDRLKQAHPTGRIVARFVLGGRAVMTFSTEPDTLSVKRAFWDLRTGKRLGPIIELRHGESCHLLPDADGRDLLVVFRYHQPAATGAREAPHSEVVRLTRSRPVEPAHRLECWDLSSGARLQSCPTFSASASARLRSDGRALLSIQGDGSTLLVPQKSTGATQWWDLATGQPIGEAWRPRRPATYAEVTGDGRSLLGLCDDWRVRLYDLASGLQRGGDIPGQGLNYW